MSNIGKRVASLEGKLSGDRTFVVKWPEGLTEKETAAFKASEMRRLGLCENDDLRLVCTGVPRADDKQWSVK